LDTLAEFLLSAVRPEHFPLETLPEVAFLGRSNCGKSTLLNCVTGQKGMAFSSSTPGRTQAVNFFRVEGKIIFVDLPGYGYAKAPLHVSRQWSDVIDAYLLQRKNLKLCCFLLDARARKSSRPGSWLEFRLRSVISASTTGFCPITPGSCKN
jgi:GTP-binding protein